VTLELAVSPAGRIFINDEINVPCKTSVVGTNNRGKRSDAESTLSRAFSDSSAAGLIELATHSNGRGSSVSAAVSVRYWGSFASRFIDKVCQLSDDSANSLGTVSALGEAGLLSMLLNVPPMFGAEYISRDLLEGLWHELNDWFRDELKSSKLSLSEFLETRFPSWHQVGRVCLHLAENRRDPDYPFAFLATYAPITSGNHEKSQYQPLGKALEQYAGAKDKDALIKLLSPIEAASQSSRFLRELVESGDIYQPLAWTPAEAYQFLKDVAVMEQSGITVRVPDWWKKRPRPRVGITIGDTKQERLGVDEMLDFRLQIALGDEELTREEFQELLDNDDGLVLIKGQWVEVDRQRLEQALSHWKAVEKHAVDGLSFGDGMRLLAGAPTELGDEPPGIEQEIWSFVDAGDWLGQMLRDMRSPGHLTAANPGKALNATLRDYQAIGVNWLAFLSDLGLGACLADDMGLGKTIQVIALLLVLKKKRTRNPSLLVLPASLLGNWKAEIDKFAPSLSVRFVHSSQVTKEEIAAIADNPTAELRGVDVVLTSYGTLPRQPWLLDTNWQLAILDEAQAIKNPSARQTKYVKQLKTASRIALTGTPVENRLGDLWSLFDFLCPGLLGTPRKFKKFIKSLESRSTEQYAPLRRLVGPYILRRLKTDKSVIADLPDKTEVTAFCGLSKRQAALYAKLVNELAKSVKDHEGIQRRGIVLSYLMRFKQLCNHPCQLLGTGDFNAKDSGKFSRLVEICEEIKSRQEKVLVFTQFREIAGPIASLLVDVFGRAGLILHGGTAVKQRKKLVDQFQQGNGPPFFVLSLKAGGTGLNLTAASHVIHFDRWWNPAVENQATDRAFRIGQKKNVLVHKFVCQGTVEERIDKLIAEKQQLTTEILERGGETMLTELSDKQLIDMVSLDVERVEL